MILTDILSATRQRLGARKRIVPPDEIKKDIKLSNCSFSAALARARTGFILECKRKSPSQGILQLAYDPARLAEIYAEHADAVSVLTNEDFFGGSLHDMQTIAQHVSVPVLCKDFIVDEYQVFEARRFGADAILLILRVLDDSTYMKCAEAARHLNMSVLSEVHTREELERAVRLGAEIIGINNRDLDTLETSLAVTEELSVSVPDDCLLICESGISGYQDVRRLGHLVDGFLVGGSLLGQSDIGVGVRALVHGFNKVCGLSCIEDARYSVHCGATHGGLIFVSDSPRRVDEKQATRLVNSAQLNWVGVFVDDRPERIAGLAASLGLAAVQLHGNENTDYIQDLRRRLPETTEIWKAIGVADQAPDPSCPDADRLLFDTHCMGRFGGTGRNFDWDLVSNMPTRNRHVLSGGLRPGNIGAARELGFGILDMNSGIETAPGDKNHQKLRQVFETLRGKARQPGSYQEIGTS